MDNSKLEVANSRGKKAVVRDLKRIQKELSTIIYELNNCEAKTQLKIADVILFQIINDPQNN